MHSKPLFIPEAAIMAYRERGAVRLPGIFREWVQPLAEAVLQVIDRKRSDLLPEPAGGFDYLNPASLVEKFGGGAMALNIVPYHANFLAWLAESPAAAMTAGIMESKTSRFWIDASFYKEEPIAEEGTPWHNDTCTWPFWGQQMTILWIALTDIGPDDGPLTTVRGSHKGDGRYYSPFFPAADTLPPPYKPWSELLEKTQAEGAVIDSWTMQAGDCLFMHPSTIHGSRPRLDASGAARLSFSTRWLGDDVLFKPDHLTSRMTERINSHPDMRWGMPPADSLIPIRWRAA